MLVWTGAMLTQFGSTVKEDHKVENTRRKISRIRAPGEPNPRVQSSPKVGHLPWGLGDVGEHCGGLFVMVGHVQLTSPCNPLG